MVKDLMGLFERDNKSEFKQSQQKIKTHLPNVVDSIERFKDLSEEVIMTFNDDRSTNVSLRGFKGNKIILKAVEMAESTNKKKLYNIIGSYIANTSNVEEYMKKSIKSKDNALDYALSLAVLDDYLDFLNGNEYKGPFTIV